MQSMFAKLALRNNMSFTYYDTLAEGVRMAAVRLRNRLDPLTFRLVARFDYEDGDHDLALAEFSFEEDIFTGDWRNQYTILNNYGDEPDALEVDGWRGELIERDYACGGLWSAREMLAAIEDATDIDAEISVTEYDPREWEFDGMHMVRR